MLCACEGAQIRGLEQYQRSYSGTSELRLAEALSFHRACSETPLIAPCAPTLTFLERAIAKKIFPCRLLTEKKQTEGVEGV